MSYFQTRPLWIISRASRLEFTLSTWAKRSGNNQTLCLKKGSKSSEASTRFQAAVVLIPPDTRRSLRQLITSKRFFVHKNRRNFVETRGRKSVRSLGDKLLTGAKPPQRDSWLEVGRGTRTTSTRNTHTHRQRDAGRGRQAPPPPPLAVRGETCRDPRRRRHSRSLKRLQDVVLLLLLHS